MTKTLLESLLMEMIMNRAVFKQALAQVQNSPLKTKSPPTLRRKPFEHPMGFYRIHDNSVSLPQGADIDTAVHEIRHAGFPHRKTQQGLQAAYWRAKNQGDSDRAKRINKLANRLMLRSEARSNAGLGRKRVAGSDSFYINHVKSTMIDDDPKGWMDVKRRWRAYQKSGGADAGAESRNWLKLSSTREVGNLREVMLDADTPMTRKVRAAALHIRLQADTGGIV